ncbi:MULTISPECIES: amidohydrolase [unclassified Aureimonas]|uniref:amidohydrolase n=1 Tax=unclassified Aureimonas TaxID=2615206 RepID=UPI0006F3ED24|nr:MULTISPECIES: amidohydrolase [unclassified Aureimonas]KQT52459.1 amidohydrolase [Aureimonas sp. Leaf427]KQT77640.1 amidohydrolase [Aureimonas sp. Leaf460]
MPNRRTFLQAASALALTGAGHAAPTQGDASVTADLILRDGRVTTLDRTNPSAEAVAIKDGLFLAVGTTADVMAHAGPATRVIDLKGRRVLPGLIDNHLHIIRGGLNFNMELRWDGVRSLADAMDMLKRQVAVTPPPQWVRVVGGFTEHQFAEKRLPTIEEINQAAPDTPVFLLHLYDRALLNGAALRAVGYTKDTPAPEGGEIVRDASGNPTGLLLAKPNAAILYATLAKGPKLPFDYQVNSTRHFMRELNRLGVTGAIDAGGGFQNYPDDYAVVQKLSDEKQLTVRLAYNLFTQKPKEEKADFLAWTANSKYKQGDDYFRHNGAGEMLVFSAADFEDFRVERPDMPAEMEDDLEGVVRVLAENRWPWRMHATYDETISRALDVFEKVNRDVPLAGLNWFFDHAETISDRSIDRIAALGGGIAVQHRMAFQGEYFVERYGAAAAEATPPVARILDKGVKTSAGTDATRVASYNPWVSLAWLITGRTVGGLRITPQRNCLDRETALRMWTENVTWFSNEEGRKGRIEAGQFADLVVPSKDFFACAEDEISHLTADLTMVGGRVVYGAGDFSAEDETDIPQPMPDWSPVRTFGGYGAWGEPERAGANSLRRTAISSCGCASACGVHGHDHAGAWAGKMPVADLKSFWGALGCACWAV